MLNICCNAKDLEKGLTLIEKAIDATNLIPVLNNFLVRTVPKNTDVFCFSQRSMQQLQQAMHADVVKKLTPLIDTLFATEKDFSVAICKLIGEDLFESKRVDFLNATQDFIIIAASDTTIVSFTYIPALVQEHGELTIPFDMLEITKRLPDDLVFIVEEDNYWLNVSCGAYASRLAGLSSKDYLELPGKIHPTQITMRQSELRSILKKTKIAVSTDASRRNLMGVSMALIDGVLHCASADGYRLAYQTTANIIVHIDNSAFDTIVPTKTITEVIKSCNDDNGNVDIAVADNKIHFYFGVRTTIIARTLDETFVNYRELFLPLLHEENRFDVAFLNKSHLVSAINRVALLCGDSFQINFQFMRDNAAARIFTNKLTKGSSSEKITVVVDKLTAPQFFIGYNYKYLKEMLAELDGDPCFSLKDEKSITFITSRDPRDANLLYILMAMLIKDVEQLQK